MRYKHAGVVIYQKNNRSMNKILNSKTKRHKRWRALNSAWYKFKFDKIFC